MSDDLFTELEKGIVYDGWYDWRVALETKVVRDNPRYRWVLERRFGRFSWEDYSHGRWTKHADRAVGGANARLNGRRENQYDRYRA